MKTTLALLVACLLSGCGRAEAAGALATAALAPRDARPMTLSSPAIGPDGAIAARQSAYGANLSPALNWKPVAGARAYALIIEDPDAHGATPFVHWLIWNIPAASSLAEAVTPPGAIQGKNGPGGVGYFGPRPPSGIHHYHLEIFALDGRLPLAAGADRTALIGALKGHVLAKGDLVGAFAAPRK